MRQLSLPWIAVQSAMMQRDSPSTSHERLSIHKRSDPCQLTVQLPGPIHQAGAGAEVSPTSKFRDAIAARQLEIHLHICPPPQTPIYPLDGAHAPNAPTAAMRPTQALSVGKYRHLKMTTKDVGRGFYKGNRTGAMGRHTKYGTYVIMWDKVRTYVVPDLKNFKVWLVAIATGGLGLTRRSFRRT